MPLRVARKERGLSVKELAKTAHISPMSLYRYERGERNPDLPTAAKLAEALSVPIESLIQPERQEGANDPLPEH